MCCRNVIQRTLPPHWGLDVLQAERFLGDPSTHNTRPCQRPQSAPSVLSCGKQAICFRTTEDDVGWTRLATC